MFIAGEISEQPATFAGPSTKPQKSLVYHSVPYPNLVFFQVFSSVDPISGQTHIILLAYVGIFRRNLGVWDENG